MQKSRDAFRTISEVADWLDVPTHVLRFWESRFSQIKPVKRAGGRRYYRPSDMRVIGGVKALLHDQGMTIRGVQKMFREEGIKHVSSFSTALDDEAAPALNDDQPVVIDSDATPAVPAPAARTSRDAEPDPIVDDVALGDVASGDDAATEDAAPMFTHRRGAPEGVDAASKTPEPAVASDAETDQSPDASPALLGPTIPETPDVPLRDPEDDAPEFATTPGIAAQLLMADASALDANRADVIEAAKRLKALLAEAS